MDPAAASGPGCGFGGVGSRLCRCQGCGGGADGEESAGPAAPAKAASPAPSTVTQPASEPMGHLDVVGGGQSAVFGKSPPPATWREVGFKTREHAEAAAAMNYVSALAFYAAMGRGELQMGPQPRPPPPRQPAQAASSSGDQAGPLDGYLAEADAKAAEDRRMREIQERIAGELRQDEADRDAASGSGSRPAQPRARFPQPATTPAPVQARYPNANRETGEGSRHFPASRLAMRRWRRRRQPTGSTGRSSRSGSSSARRSGAPTSARWRLPALTGVRGMRVPERLNGEVWVVGWCGRPCPAGRNCLSSVERCLRPIVVRRGTGAQLGDLAAHEHHECSECHRAGRRGRDY